MSSTVPPEAGADRRPDPAASMSLLTELIERPLDPAYQWEADRRAAQGMPRSDSLRSPWLILVAFVVGLALAISAASLRAPRGEAQKERDDLIHRIQDRQQDVSDDNSAITRLRQEISEAQTSALTQNDKPAEAADLRRLAAMTGDAAAAGPGFKLTLNDPATPSADQAGDPRGTTISTNKLTSSDLQVIVNGLWQSGAEAVSINGQRITSLTAIRFAGEAVLVNFRPLIAPYVVTAIGPQDMQKKFEQTAAGPFLQGLVDQFGVTKTFESGSRLVVPALAIPDLRYAKSLKETK